jgi:hypothetical protein
MWTIGHGGDVRNSAIDALDLLTCERTWRKDFNLAFERSGER